MQNVIRSTPLFALLGAAALLFAPTAVAQDELTEEQRKLLDELRKPTSTWAMKAAAQTLKEQGGAAAAEAGKLLQVQQAKRAKEWAAAARKINGLAARVGNGKAQAELLKQWTEARDHANKWLFDPVKFPLPKVQPVTGPLEGCKEGLARGAVAMGFFRQLEKPWGAAAAPVLALRYKSAKKLRAAYVEAEKGQKLVTELLGAGGATPKDAGAEVSPLGWFFLDLAEEQWADAAARYRTMKPGWAKSCAWYAYCAKMMKRNEVTPCEMEKPAIRGLKQNNEYRMSLGISPLWHNAKLARAAQGHATEMQQMGYFGHDSPVAKNASPQLRCKNEGYEGGVTECASSTSSPSSAMEMWKWDGGHHRAMIHWRWTEGGCSSTGKCTFNPGTGTYGSPPGLRY
jgi:hypothetical protein